MPEKSAGRYGAVIEFSSLGFLRRGHVIEPFCLPRPGERCGWFDEEHLLP